MRPCCGATGVVGDSGWEVIPLCSAGSIDGNRSTSRTGLKEKPSVVSIEGIDVVGGWSMLFL